MVPNAQTCINQYMKERSIHAGHNVRVIYCLKIKYSGKTQYNTSQCYSESSNTGCIALGPLSTVYIQNCISVNLFLFGMLLPWQVIQQAYQIA